MVYVGFLLTRQVEGHIWFIIDFVRQEFKGIFCFGKTEFKEEMHNLVAIVVVWVLSHCEKLQKIVIDIDG